MKVSSETTVECFNPMLSSGLTVRSKVLVFLGRYLPGFNSGGPVRTVSSMIESLAPYFEFFVVTLNADSGSREPYKTVKTGAWNTVGAAQVFYTERFTTSQMQAICDEVRPDVIYLNGFFSTSSVKALLKRRLGGFPGLPVVLATRGDLASGALGLKSAKKRCYLTLAKALGLYRDLIWHASSEREKQDILPVAQQFGATEEQIHVAPDLGGGYGTPSGTRPAKTPGEARFVTLGRISRMKNLPFAIERLGELRGAVSLDIFGPLEDKDLWSECQQKIARVPENVTVRYCGPIDPVEVIGELATRHFFILPTLGENYGHVIIEAAAAGCPVVISNRTQWQGLAEKAIGWDVALEDTEAWRLVLQRCVDMPQDAFAQLSAHAREFGHSVMQSPENLRANIELFQRVVASDPQTPAFQVAGAAK